MKYMGSKRWMLRNGLGHLITDEIKKADRFLDFFTGSGAVAHFAATTGHPTEVRAFDLQQFCVALANGVVSRSRPLESDTVWNAWLKRSTERVRSDKRSPQSEKALVPISKFTRAYVERERELCAGGADSPI